MASYNSNSSTPQFKNLSLELKGALKVLAYHNVVDIKNFKNQLEFLKSTYNIINLLQLKNFFFLEGKLPDNPLLITFDDGDFSLYEKAFPVLKELKIPAIVFIITELLNSNKPFWWDEIEFYLGKEQGNKKVWEVKEWENKDRLEYLEVLRQKNIQKVPSTRQLSSNEVKKMNEEGFIVANHSHTHPMLNQCSKSEIINEMSQSMTVLKSLNLESEVFAYPNGNFSDSAEDVLIKNGIKLAFLFDHKINKKEIHPLRISRVAVDDTTPIWKLRFILSGWHTKLLPITRGLGWLRN